jgi:hypothetical protein
MSIFPVHLQLALCNSSADMVAQIYVAIATLPRRG